MLLATKEILMELNMKEHLIRIINTKKNITRYCLIQTSSAKSHHFYPETKFLRQHIFIILYHNSLKVFSTDQLWQLEIGRLISSLYLLTIDKFTWISMRHHWRINSWFSAHLKNRKTWKVARSSCDVTDCRPSEKHKMFLCLGSVNPSTGQCVVHSGKIYLSSSILFCGRLVRLSNYSIRTIYYTSLS